MIEEPLGGASRPSPNGRPAEDVSGQNAPRAAAKPTDKLLDARYDKFRQMGQFLEGAEAAAALEAPAKKSVAAAG